MKMSRRSLALITVAIPALFTGGCSLIPGSGGSNLATLKTEFDDLVNSLNLAIKDISSLSPAIGDTLNKYYLVLQNADTAFQAITSINGSGFNLVNVENAVNAIVAAATKLPAIPNSVDVILVAVQIVLPVIEAGINAMVSPPKVSTFKTPTQLKNTDPATIKACEAVLSNAAKLHKATKIAPKGIYY